MLGNELNNLLKTIDNTALVAHKNYKKTLPFLNSVNSVHPLKKN